MLLRAVGFVLRLGILCVPIALILFQCYRYGQEMLLALLDPRAPVVYVLQTEAGPLQARVENYRIDLSSLTITAQRFRLSEASGRTLLSLDEATIPKFDPQGGLSQPITVRARGLFLRIRRGADGSLEFQKYLPKTKGPPGLTPFFVSLRDARVLYEDDSPARRITQEFASKRVLASGLGDDLVFSGKVQVSGAGAVALRGQQTPGPGFLLHARTVGLTPERLLKDFGILGLPPDIEVSKPVVSGSAVAWLPPKGPFRTVAAGTIRSESLKQGDWQVRQSQAEFSLSEEAARIRASGALPDGKVTFVGGAKFGAWQVAGAVTGQLARADSLPGVRLADGIRVAGLAANGWIAAGDRVPLRYQAVVSAKSVEVPSVPAVALVARLYGDDKRMSFAAENQLISASLASGIGSYSMADGRLNVAAVAPTIRPETVRQLAKSDQIQFTGSATAFAEGAENILIDLAGGGQLGWRGESSQPFASLGEISFAGNWAKNQLNVSRAVVAGPVGLASAEGTLRPNGAAEILVKGRNLQLTQLDAETKGVASIRGSIRGTLSNPRLLARVEVYNFERNNQYIPLIAAEGTADLKRVQLSSIKAVSGTSLAKGDAEVQIAGRRLSGELSVSNLQLSDYVEEGAFGSLDFPKIVLGGTLSRPQLRATGQGENLVVASRKVEKLPITATLIGNNLYVRSSGIEGLEGTANVDLSYNLITGNGRGNIQAMGLELESIINDPEQPFDLTGRVSGTGSFGFASSAFLAAEFDGDLEGVVINGTAMGAGTAVLRYGYGQVLGDIQVGGVDRYLVASKIKFDPEAQTLGLRLDANRFEISDLVEGSQRYREGFSYDANQQLALLKGEFNLGGTFSGPLLAPDLDIDILEAKNLTLSGRKLGDIKAAVSRIGRKWNIGSLETTGPVVRLQAKGTAEEGGAIAIDGEIASLDFAELTALIPSASKLAGSVTVPFLISGETLHPTIQASVNTLPADTLRPINDDPLTGLSLDFPTVQLVPSAGTEEGKLTLEGTYKLRGFEGSAVAALPYLYPLSIPRDKDIAVRVALKQRTLQEIAELSGALDPARTEGSASGSVSFTGPLENLLYDGNLTLNAPKLGLNAYAGSFQNVSAAARLDKNGLHLDLKADHSEGGKLTFVAQSPLSVESGLTAALTERSLSALLDRQITAKLTLDGFRYRQKFAGDSFVAATATGDLTATGTLRSPLIQGGIGISRASSVIPFLEPAAGRDEPPTVNPKFDIRIDLAEAANLRSATAELYILGGGKLQGSLSNPFVLADMLVERGSIRLPGGLVRLEQGGDAKFVYDGTQRSPVAQLLLDVEGRTSITAADTFQTVNRYDVYINLRGDLVKENGLNLSARSDPPGLSQDRVIALLGQTDILTALGDSNKRSGAEEQVRNALTGYAVPAVFEKLTSDIARSLGLDYLSLDYNPFDRASILFARALNKDFVLQGQRQLSEPQPGFPVKFDFRLSYRPRRAKGIINQLNFSIGTDERRPIKFSIDYGIRF